MIKQLKTGVFKKLSTYAAITASIEEFIVDLKFPILPMHLTPPDGKPMHLTPFGHI